MRNDFYFPALIAMLIYTNAFANFICSARDEQYLRQILKETWSYLDRHLADETGFPTDSQHAGGTTNTTNIGLYLASIGPAEKMGFISTDNALGRINKILDSLAKIESRNGFLYNWLDVGGDTKLADGVMAVSDFNKLVTGLILIRQFFPQAADKASPLIERINWSRLYDATSGRAYWGYDLKNDKPVGLCDFWLASDCRSVVFYMIASGAAPVELWDKMNRSRINADGLSFYAPGYWFGGFFMSAIDAIFLDPPDRAEMGSAIGDFAWHQICMAQQKKLPVWGWSNCNIPGKGYTEGGYLPWWVVTPHASALAIEYYPRRVIKNLRRLDKMGLRQPLPAGGNYGFRDSVDLKTGKVDDRYLSLDQAMLFLSITNYLENQMVRKHFANDPLVQKGFKLLGNRLAQDANLLNKWQQRDSSEPKRLSQPEVFKNIVLDMKKSDSLILNTNTVGGGKIDAKFTAEGLVIDFNSTDESELDTVITFPQADIRGLKAVEIVGSVRTKEEFGGIRLYLYDSQGQSLYTYTENLQPTRKIVSIPESSIYGILAQPNAVDKLVIKLWVKPWFYANQKINAKSGGITIEKIIFKQN
jgi:hypothetical protein